MKEREHADMKQHGLGLLHPSMSERTMPHRMKEKLKQFFNLRQEGTFLGLLSFDKYVADLNREYLFVVEWFRYSS